MDSIRIYDSEQFPELFVEKQQRVFKLGDLKVIIAKHNGVYQAFEHLCPHQRHPLKDSIMTAFGEVVCPLHEYRFSLKTGEEAHQKCKALKRYPLEIKAGGVYLSV